MSPHTVIRLALTLVPSGTGTRITAMFVMTAIDDIGDTLLSDFDITICEQLFKPGFLMLDHYLRTGKMLAGTEAAAQAATHDV
ncbi:hypothetical protein KL86APRO_20268 [uncultured Alphaproteobacteria bacterium]|uniref:Uncharacterized protein n=1 Tax=uncultured Alphaproteobacteria bacterium TaxID=91750 RepID=A0A212KIZ6_9PROT|nr:hypothetical protein KL86APRO_20268 [uncultured Alphaproteobacteria bacterium]